MRIVSLNSIVATEVNSTYQQRTYHPLSNYRGQLEAKPRSLSRGQEKAYPSILGKEIIKILITEIVEKATTIQRLLTAEATVGTQGAMIVKTEVMTAKTEIIIVEKDT
jgi:hypothetical protein